MIELPKGTRIWLSAGATDMRRGFDGLAAKDELLAQKDAELTRKDTEIALGGIHI